MLTCDAEGCSREANVVLRFRDQPGHVHVCPVCEAIDREWGDVVASYPLPCPWRCAPDDASTVIGHAVPTLL